MSYRIYGRKQYKINTDPMRRCYDGCHAKSELTWGEWVHLGTVFSREEAEASVKSWYQLNPDRFEYKFTEHTE